MRAVDQLSLDGAEDRVRQILESRRKANASGQRGEDADNIRAAYDAEMAITAGGSGTRDQTFPQHTPMDAPEGG